MLQIMMKQIFLQKFNMIKIQKNKTGRISNIVINNKSFKRTKFRSLLGLRSTDINIKKQLLKLEQKKLLKNIQQ